jgi:ubiquitin carboxyl-terminal hydrolase 14
MHSNSFIDKYFGGIFKVEMKCRESEDEPPVYSTENFLQLSCFISAGI